MLEGFVGNEALRLSGPSEIFLGAFELLSAQGFTVSRRRVLLIGTTEADLCSNGNHRGASGLLPGLEKGLFHCLKIIAVVHVLNVPTVSCKAAQAIPTRG